MKSIFNYLMPFYPNGAQYYSKSLILLFHVGFFMLTLLNSALAQCPSNPPKAYNPDTTVSCSGTVPLRAPSAVNYSFSITNIPCTSIGTGGTNAFPTACDDCVTGQVAIGFPFNFLGTSYSTAVIQSNGIVGFGNFTFIGFSAMTIPSPSGANNYIAGLYMDIDIRNGGTINYQTIGTTPNRQFVVSYVNVAAYGTSAPGRANFQIILNENGSFQTRITEWTSDWNASTSGTLATQGFENIGGTFAGTTTGRNSQDFRGITPANPSCHLFSPLNCTFLRWQQGATVLSTSGNYTASPTGNTTYTAYFNCPTGECTDDVVVTTTIPPTGTGVSICQNSVSEAMTAGSVLPVVIAPSTPFNAGVLATTDLQWSRNSSGTSCNGSAGTSNYYDVYPFTVTTTGSYTLNMCSSFDFHASLYQNAFDGTNPCGTPSNFVSADDDGNSICSSNPRITVTLAAGVSYYLVSTSFSAGATGAYSWTYTGAGNLLGGTNTLYQWFTTPTGGTSIATGVTFNPVGVAGSGLANTNTAGTTVYYLANAVHPVCRTPINYTIKPFVPVQIYVKRSATAGTNNGTSWTNAYTDLQSALNAGCFAPNTEIWVAADTYKPTATTDRTIAFNVPSNVKIYGGFAGTETALTQRPANILGGGANTTILSGNIGAVGSNTDNSHNIIKMIGNSTTLVDGFTIEEANTPSVSSAKGAVTATTGGGGNLSNCLIRTNSGNSFAALHYSGGAVGSITKSVFYNNTSTSSAVGIDANTNTTMSNVVFANNTTTNDAADLHLLNNTASLTNCTFYGSTGGTSAVKVSVSGASPTLTNCIVWAASPNAFEVSNGTTLTTTYCDVKNPATGGGTWNNTNNIRV
jgi:hypothetical protein